MNIPLCLLLQITTREDINSKQAAPAKADLEPESFRPNLSDPSELLLPDQIEKVCMSAAASVCAEREADASVPLQLSCRAPAAAAPLHEE